jgi:hypothetical protein
MMSRAIESNSEYILGGRRMFTVVHGGERKGKRVKEGTATLRNFIREDLIFGSKA